MEPGRVYVGRLPGYKGPVLVRRQKKRFCNPFGAPEVTSIFTTQHSPPAACHCSAPEICNQQPPPMLVSQPPVVLPSQQIVQQPIAANETSTTTVTTHHGGETQQIGLTITCTACGKYRSPRYHYRNPLFPGETQRFSLCRKCANRHTSSEDSEDSEDFEQARKRKKKRKQTRRRKERRRRACQNSSSDEWSICSSLEERRGHCRHGPPSEDPRHPRRGRQSPGSSISVYVMRQPEDRGRRRSSSESVHVVRETRTTEDRPGFLRRPRFGQDPFDGHYSYEDRESEFRVEIDEPERRGRTRSRHWVGDPYCFEEEEEEEEEEEYVRITTGSPRRGPFGFLDPFNPSRSRSRSRNRGRWRRERSASFEEERLRVPGWRDRSPRHYERRECEREERIEESNRSPLRHRSNSHMVQRDRTTEDYFDSHPLSRSGHVYDSRRFRRRSRDIERPSRPVRILGIHSPLSARRRLSIRGTRRGPHVRFARSRSRSVHREGHAELGEPHRRHRSHGSGSGLSLSSSDEFITAGKLNWVEWIGSDHYLTCLERLLHERGYRHIRAPTPPPVRVETRHRYQRSSSHHDDDDSDISFGPRRTHLTPPVETYSYARRRSYSSSRSGSGRSSPFSHDMGRRMRIIDV